MQITAGTLGIRHVQLSHYFLNDNEDLKIYLELSGRRWETYYSFSVMNLLSTKPMEVLKADTERWTVD